MQDLWSRGIVDVEYIEFSHNGTSRLRDMVLVHI